MGFQPMNYSSGFHGQDGHATSLDHLSDTPWNPLAV
jgi:hypothetical protein